MPEFQLPRMPEIQLPPGAEIAFNVLSALLAAFGLFLILMTLPSFGTPVTNWALKNWGPGGASVQRAHTSFPGLTTLSFRAFGAPERADISSGKVRANLFGFLPGVAWVSRAEAASGHLYLVRNTPETEQEDSFSLTRMRHLIDEIALNDIEVRYTRRDEARTFTLNEASGSLRSGSLVLDATGAGSTLAFVGNADASTLSTLAGELRLSGDNFADFAWLAGFASPDTPPYDAVADLSVAGNRVTIDFRPETRIGDSDLSGPLAIVFGGGTPVIDADLRSANLDFDDLGIIFGIPIGVGEGETVNAEQTRAREILDESTRLIPDAVIDFTRLDAVDGNVKFHADQVSDAIFDIRGLKLEVEIEGPRRARRRWCS